MPVDGRSRSIAWRSAVAIGSVVAIAAAAAELCAREVARASLAEAAFGAAPSIGAILAVTVAAALAGFLARPRAATVLLFSTLFTIGLALQLRLGARLQSDGFYYFSYLRSLTFDRDVEFTNDYRLLGLREPHLYNLTRTNHAQSAWTIGPAIVWSPFFGAGHLVARSLSANDPNVSANGISFPYRQAVCIAGLFYGLLGCWFIYRFTALFFGRGIAAGACVATVAGSFMLWYIIREPSMTHAPSMALVAAFAWAWAGTRDGRTLTQWGLLGLLAGFMTLVRWQNALFALLPAWDVALMLVAAWRGSDRRRAVSAIAAGALFTAAATVAFVPQMLAWRAIYGSWLAVSPIGPRLDFLHPKLVDILWSARNGLLSTAPILYGGAIGLVMFAVARPSAGVPVLAAVAAMTWFNAAIQDWWGSAGFGGRRFDGTIPFFALGVACLGERTLAFVRRFPAVALGASGVLLVLWNVTFMSAAHAGVVRIGQPVAFGEAMAAQAAALHRWFGNPFSYPASLAFAARNGVSPARYDLLSGDRFLGDPLRPYGRIEVGGDDTWLLGGGWHQPEQDAGTTFRWSTARSLVLVPLDHAAPLRLQIRLHAFAHPGAPPQTVILAVNGRLHGPVPVPGGWQVAELMVPADAWRAGVNHVDLQFAWERRPMDVGLGGDARPLSAAVDYVRVAVAE